MLEALRNLYFPAKSIGNLKEFILSGHTSGQRELRNFRIWEVRTHHVLALLAIVDRQSPEVRTHHVLTPLAIVDRRSPECTTHHQFPLESGCLRPTGAGGATPIQTEYSSTKSVLLNPNPRHPNPPDD